MKEDRSEFMIIKLEVESGEVVEVVDENGKKAERVCQDELVDIYRSKTGFRHLGTMLHTHSSPGCITVVIFGKAFRLCNVPRV